MAESPWIVRIRELEDERDALGNALARERAKPGGSYDQAAYDQLAAERDVLREALSQACEDIEAMLSVSPQTLLKIEAERNLRHYRAVLERHL